MPGVTKEQIQAAREADLFTYLQFHEPGVLKQDGPNFRHKEHDSLVYVTGKRYWYWNSRGRSINALDYLIQIRGYGLVDAVHALVGGEIPQEPAYRSTAEIQVSKEPEKKTFALPWARRCATAAVFYLQKRGISSEVIRQCLQAGIFYSHLFTEISPPIPKEYEHHFMVHGTLLPGYTVEGLEQAKTEHAAAEVSEGGIFTPKNREKPSVLGKLSVAKTQEKTPTTPGTAMKKKEDIQL